MNETHEKILACIGKLGIASITDICNNTGLSKSTVSRNILYLLNAGLIVEHSKEGKKIYYTLSDDFQKGEDKDEIPHIQIPKEVDSISGILAYVRRVLDQHNWSSSQYRIPITALLISKYTNLKLIILGSQASGKTSCIKAVFPNAEENPFILFDMHRKNLYDYVSAVKEHTKIIEQQYLHNWKIEDTKEFDKYEIVPTSQIGPTEFLFRFIPLRITQPPVARYGFKPFTIDLKDFKPVKKIPNELQEKFTKALSNLQYFTNDVGACQRHLEMLMEKEIARLYYVDREGNPDPQISAKQWKIERKYRTILKNPLWTVNYEKLREFDSLWYYVVEDLQMMLNAFEILRFAYSLNKDADFAIQEAFNFLKMILRTWTITRGSIVLPKKEKSIRKLEGQTWYKDSAGVVHNVI